MRRLRRSYCAWHFALAIALPLPALAFDELELDRDRAGTPGLTLVSTLGYDARDSAYGEDGGRRDGAVAGYGGGKLEQTRLDLHADWRFPLFAADGIPFVSDRLWAARAASGAVYAHSEGPIADAANANGGPRAKSGIADLDLAFGPVLVGSTGWNAEAGTAPYEPLSVLLLAEARLPIGARDPNAPNNAGDGVYAIGARLGAHWQPRRAWLTGWFLDGGVRYRHYGRDDEPAFYAQSPAQPGDDLIVDLTLARRIVRRLYAQVSFVDREGESNEYRGVRASAHPPPPPMSGPLTPPQDTFPDPGTFRDGGTNERRVQFGVEGFLTQRLRLGLHYALSLDGASGGFDLPYVSQTRNCAATNSCMPMRYGSDHVDGLGSARAFASDYALLSLSYAFPQGGGP